MITVEDRPGRARDRRVGQPGAALVVGRHRRRRRRWGSRGILGSPFAGRLAARHGAGELQVLTMRSPILRPLFTLTAVALSTVVASCQRADSILLVEVAGDLKLMPVGFAVTGRAAPDGDAQHPGRAARGRRHLASGQLHDSAAGQRHRAGHRQCGRPGQQRQRDRARDGHPAEPERRRSDDLAGHADGGRQHRRDEASRRRRCLDAHPMSMRSRADAHAGAASAGPRSMRTPTGQHAMQRRLTRPGAWMAPRAPEGSHEPRTTRTGRGRRRIRGLALATAPPDRDQGRDRRAAAFDRRGSGRPGRRAGPVPRRRHAVLLFVDRPGPPGLSRADAGDPARARAGERAGRSRRSARRGQPLAGDGHLPQVPGPLPAAGAGSVRDLLPALQPPPAGRPRGIADHAQRSGPGAGLHQADAGHPRRPDLGR